MPRPQARPRREPPCADHIWGPALDKAKAEGRSLTAVITHYLRRYISTPPNVRPKCEDGPH